MRNKTIRTVFMIVVLVLSLVNGVNAYTFKGSTGEMDMAGYETHYRTFYSNHSERYYMIFSEYDGASWAVVYSHSPFGYSFSNSRTLLNKTGSLSTAQNTFALYLEPNGYYLHVAWMNETNHVWYRKFNISSNGVISSLTDDAQLVLEAQGWEGSWEARDELSIVANTDGYPYLGAECFSGGQNSYFVWNSTMNNGTWNTEVFGWYNTMDSEWIDNGGGNPPNTQQGGNLLPANGNDIIVTWWWANLPFYPHATMIYDASQDDWILNQYMMYDGSEGDWAFRCWNFAWNLEANKTVVAKVHENNPDGVIAVEAQIIDHSTYTWGANIQISFDEIGDAGSTVFNPFVSVSDTGAMNFVWYIAGNTTIWGNRMYPNETMEGWSVIETSEFALETNQFSMTPTILGIDRPSGIQWMDDIGTLQVADELYYDTEFSFIDSNFSLPYVYYNTTIFGLHNDWMFRGERYQIESYVANATTFQVNFTDGIHEVLFQWDNTSKRLYVENDLERDFVIGLYASDYEEYSGGIHRLRWEFILDTNIHDVLNTTFSYELYNEEFNATINGDTGIEPSIYSLGAIVSYEFDGDGGRTTGGDSLEVHHTNSTGNGALVEVIYRRLQHAHLAFSLDVDDNDCFNLDENSAVVDIGIKYLTSSGWVDGWYLELSIPLGAVILGGAGGGNAWIRPNVAWYARDTDGNVNNIKSDTITGYPNAGNKINEDITDTDFYVDLWFNTMNSSTTVGGRLSPKYYGMKETGWMLWTNWSPLKTNVSESMFFYDLLDTTGNVTQPIDIELMKFWIRVLKSGNGAGSCDTHTWRISNPELSVTLATDRMEALNTPDGIDTLVIDMPSGGWMQPIAKAIQGIGNAISGAMFGVIKMLIGALDTLLVDVLGSPVSMSQMINWIMIQSSYISTWMVTVIARVSDMLTVFTTMITFVLQIVDRAVSLIIWVSTNVIGFPIVVLNMFIEIGRDGVFTLYGVTYDWSSGQGLVQGFMVLLPTFLGWWLVMWILYNDIYGRKEIDIQGAPRRMLSIFGWMKEIFESVFWVFNRMRNEIISLYNFIRSHIPQIGGGGGETAE